MKQGKVDVCVGLQYGSEGKGKIVNFLADKYAAGVRVGAPNAGHTIYHLGKKYVMRHVPCTWTNKNCALYIGAGALINPEVLEQELMQFEQGEISSRLKIDINAGVITRKDIEEEEGGEMNSKNGSTCEGVGAAASRKVRRNGDALLAGQIPELESMVTCVADELNMLLDNGRDILIEGTQGFGLCINHGDYPFVTSRDIIASSLLSDAGLSPRFIGEIVGVMRTYPIRVAGNSGDIGNEVSWEYITQASGSPVPLNEKTTVTKRTRRVGLIDWELLEQAVLLNRPTYIAITFIDYINYSDKGVKSWANLSQKSKNFVFEVEKRLNTPVGLISSGAYPEDIIDVRQGR